MFVDALSFKKLRSPASSLSVCHCQYFSMSRRLRKVQKAEAEGQRRSPRISALEAHGQLDEEEEGTVFRTRQQGTNKRSKLRPLPLKQHHSINHPPNHQDVKHSFHQHIPKKLDQPSKLPSSTFLPEKRILELVLDTLQRRDTYEIFAEPVDPNEVEDYYAIIKEPMDFGTMRAKLHEGMYKSLEQFEHDVFLIFNNAMHFNSSGTIYFRQARVINDLAKKVFDVLRINPEKFELEFSETKRKASRRNQLGEFRESKDMKSSNEITICEPSKTVPIISSRGTSNRKSFKTNYHGCSDIANHVDATDVEVPKDTKDRSRCNRPFEVDRRRYIYRPLSLHEDDTIFSTVHGKLKLLEHVNQHQDVGYRESLMLFVKDLGPTAQNIAKRKLLGCETRTAFSSSSAPWKASDTFNSSRRFPSFSSYRSNDQIMRSPATGSGEKVLNGEIQPCPLQGTNIAQGSSHKWSLGLGFDNNSHYSRVCATQDKCGMMLLDKDKPKLKFMGSSSDFSSCFIQARSQNNMQISSSTNEIIRSCSSEKEALKILKPADQPVMPLANSSSFVFNNLSYLKTQVDHQINSSSLESEQRGSSGFLLQQDYYSSSNKRPFSSQVLGSYPYQQQVLIRNPPTTLCTQNQQRYIEDIQP